MPTDAEEPKSDEQLDDGYTGFDTEDYDALIEPKLVQKKEADNDDEGYDTDDIDDLDVPEPNAGNKVVGYDPTKDQRRKAM